MSNPPAQILANGQGQAHTTWAPHARATPSIQSDIASNNTYLMPSSPLRKARAANDNYKPTMMKTCGQRPACLVNASVNYVGDNAMYVFGGFDQFTDEGKVQD